MKMFSLLVLFTAATILSALLVEFTFGCCGGHECNAFWCNCGRCDPVERPGGRRGYDPATVPGCGYFSTQNSECYQSWNEEGGFQKREDSRQPRNGGQSIYRCRGRRSTATAYNETGSKATTAAIDQELAKKAFEEERTAKARTFDVIDENDDDNVSLEEAKRFAADERNASPTRLAGDDWYNALDLNKDGRVDQTEFQMALE